MSECSRISCNCYILVTYIYAALLTKGGAKSPIVASGLADCREWRPDDPGLFIFMLISKDDLFG